MAHAQYGEDIHLAYNLLVDVRWPLRNHRHPNASNPALLYKAAHRSQTQLLQAILHHLRSEGIGLIDVEVKRCAIDPQQLACEVGGEPDLIVRKQQTHVEDRRVAMLYQSAGEHTSRMGLERHVGMIAAEDDHWKAGSFA